MALEPSDQRISGAGGIPSSEAFGTLTIRTSRPEAWLQLGLKQAFDRLTDAMAGAHGDASAVWPALFETVTWAVTNAERQGTSHDLRSAVEFVRDGVVHGTFDAIEPRGHDRAAWYWRDTQLLAPPTQERNRGPAWRRKQRAYDRELSGRRVIDALAVLVGQLS